MEKKRLEDLYGVSRLGGEGRTWRYPFGQRGMSVGGMRFDSRCGLM